MEACAEMMELTSRDGVRLTGAYSEALNPSGLVIFLHGWEGSINSTYVGSCGRFLFDKGLSVFRLNFRDHGDTHHLNEEPFHSARLLEVQDCVRQAAELAGDLPVYLIGFSLGGNFALRIAANVEGIDIPNLAHILAVSPVIDPLAASPLIDKHPLIRRYFHKKWTTSLTKKQAAFPDLYNFAGMADMKLVMELSEKFIPMVTEFTDASEYFMSYRVPIDRLKNCAIPITVISAQDDAVIPAEQCAGLEALENVRLVLTRWGGHNGFFESLRGPTYYDRIIADTLGLA